MKRESTYSIIDCNSFVDRPEGKKKMKLCQEHVDVTEYLVKRGQVEECSNPCLPPVVKLQYCTLIVVSVVAYLNNPDKPSIFYINLLILNRSRHGY